jgi:hypothetical protein
MASSNAKPVLEGLDAQLRRADRFRVWCRTHL